MVGNDAPLAVQNKFLDVNEASHWVLEHSDRYGDSWAARASVESIIQEHIPDVMDAYLQVINRENEAHVSDINHTPGYLWEGSQTDKTSRRGRLCIRAARAYFSRQTAIRGHAGS